MGYNSVAAITGLSSFV